VLPNAWWPSSLSTRFGLIPWIASRSTRGSSAASLPFGLILQLKCAATTSQGLIFPLYISCNIRPHPISPGVHSVVSACVHQISVAEVPAKVHPLDFFPTIVVGVPADSSLVAIRAAFVSRTPAWVHLWVHYGSDKRCVGLFSPL
jgi:hypothetical protein